MNLLLKAVFAGGALAMACATHAATLYSQPYDGTGNLYASQNDTGGGNGQFALAYDDFTLSSASNVNGVAFTGGYYNPGPPGSIANFVLNIYTDMAGTPGSAIAFGTFPGNGGENCPGGGNICTYSLSFGDFAMTAGTYWISVSPDMPFPPQWGWATSGTGTGNAYQCFLGTCGAIGGTNLAFDVMGAPVPEPETYALMLAGLGALAVVARRRQQS